MAKKTTTASEKPSFDVTINRQACLILIDVLNKTDALKTRLLNMGACELLEHPSLDIPPKQFARTAEAQDEAKSWMNEAITLSGFSERALNAARIALNDMMKKGVGFDTAGGRIAFSKLLVGFGVDSETGEDL